MEIHTEIIECPNCGSIQKAEVKHTNPFYSYFHICQVCLYDITESEWNEEKTQKPIPKMQTTLIEVNQQELKHILAGLKKRKKKLFNQIKSWDKKQQDDKNPVRNLSQVQHWQKSDTASIMEIDNLLVYLSEKVVEETPCTTT